ncbi:MAG: PAS domain S-box protein, partial [Deltaproteobacteria bacterium]|nr:PAS domain S-box protein [Deltaproteobacteria bacterium]
MSDKICREMEQKIEEMEQKILRLKQEKNAAHGAMKYAESIVDTVREPLLVLDRDLRVISANRSFYGTFRVTPEDTIGFELFALGNRQWDIPRLRKLLGEVLSENIFFEDFEVEHYFETIGRKVMRLNARVLASDDGAERILLAIEDVTEQTKARERTEHLVSVLRGLRSVNQLITKEKDPQSLIQEVCRALVNTLSFDTAWIALLDESGEFLFASDAGIGEPFKEMIQNFRHGRFPRCARRAFRQAEALVMESMIFSCKDCPLWGRYNERGALAGRLEHNGRIYGMMCVTLHSFFAASRDIRELFEELSRDLALALYAVDMRREREKGIERLRASEERYRDLYEMAPSAYFTVRPDERGTVVDCNLAAERLFGYDRATLRTMSALDLCADTPEGLQKAMELLGRCNRGEPVRDIPLMMRHRAGHSLWVGLSVDPQHDSSGNIVQLLLMMTNLTERMRAEEILRDKWRQMQTIFDGINEVIYVSDPRTYEVLFANKALRDLLGKDPVGSVCYKEFHGFNSPCDFCKNELLFKNREKPIQFENRWPGTDRDFLVTNRIIDWPDGRDVRFEIACDITKQKKLETQLRHAQKMEVVGTLVSGISHDFNNLLQAIYGYTQILLMDKRSDDVDWDRLKGIEEAAGRARDLLQQLLIFSRKVESRKRPVDLNREIRQGIKILRRTIPRMIDIQFREGPNLRMINADPVQMGQVVMNLSVNARDAMPEGGELIIETGNVILDQEYADSHLWVEPGEYVCLSVSDTGVGMDKETMEHIFEPFFTTKEIGKGTGLGLSTVYGIVQDHGGHITCQSEPGKGTTFRVYLPVLAADHSGREENGGREDEDLPGGKETILLVDDDDMLRKTGSEMLQRFGYRVLTAESGEKALEVYRENKEKIALVILDLVMPGMGGKRCLEKLIEMDPGVRVLVASGYSANGLLEDSLRAGAMVTILKPFEMKELMKAVRKALDQEI